jgi:hypothetical protein
MEDCNFVCVVCDLKQPAAKAPLDTNTPINTYMFCDAVCNAGISVVRERTIISKVMTANTIITI